MTDEDKRLISAYHAFFTSPQGMLIMKDLSVRCFEHDSTIVFDNQYATAYNEGRRSILLGIKRMIAKKLE